VITRVPVLIGEGIPLFGSLPHDISLRHVATRSYKGGLVQSEYAVGKAPRTRERKTSKAPARTKRRRKS
jgi:hypothetical protein